MKLTITLDEQQLAQIADALVARMMKKDMTPPAPPAPTPPASSPYIAPTPPAPPAYVAPTPPAPPPPVYAAPTPPAPPAPPAPPQPPVALYQPPVPPAPPAPAPAPAPAAQPSVSLDEAVAVGQKIMEVFGPQQGGPALYNCLLQAFQASGIVLPPGAQPLIKNLPDAGRVAFVRAAAAVLPQR